MDDPDRILRLIRQRLDGALSEDELAEVEAALLGQPAPTIVIPAELASALVTAIERIEDRLEAMMAAHAEREAAAALIDSAPPAETTYQ